jgi:hypothetical protein
VVLSLSCVEAGRLEGHSWGFWPHFGAISSGFQWQHPEHEEAARDFPNHLKEHSGRVVPQARADTASRGCAIGSPIFPQLIERTPHSAHQGPAGAFDPGSPAWGNTRGAVSPGRPLGDPELLLRLTIWAGAQATPLGEDQSDRRLGGASVPSRARGRCGREGANQLAGACPRPAGSLAWNAQSAPNVRSRVSNFRRGFDNCRARGFTDVRERPFRKYSV